MAADDLLALQKFGEGRIKRIRKLCHKHTGHHISAALILAIGLRESNLKNAAGDFGHGRGFLQIDDRSHGDWLETVGGCRSGTWVPIYPYCLPAGRVPTLRAATKYAIGLLQANLSLAESWGIPERQHIPFMIAAYNCGPGNARTGWVDYQDVDALTTGGDYSRDVLKRRSRVARHLDGID